MTTLTLSDKTTNRPLPTPPGEPILGHMRSFRGDILGFLRQLVQEYDELVHLKLAHVDVCLLFDADLVREVFVKRASEFTKGDLNINVMKKGFGNGLVISTGEFHRKQRKLMQPVFHHSRIQSYAPMITTYTGRVLDDWQTGTPLDLHEEMMKLTMYIAGKALFDADMESLADEAHTVASAIASNQVWLEKEFWLGFPVPAWLPTKGNRTVKRNIRTLHEVLQPIIDAHRAQPSQHKDLLTLLMDASDPET
ncbi:MAG: cytochrome P450, partial [Anaerolineales bacterium]|nr:cytochrome P450 [Anaerolineales bacterium]